MVAKDPGAARKVILRGLLVTSGSKVAHVSAQQVHVAWKVVHVMPQQAHHAGRVAFLALDKSTPPNQPEPPLTEDVCLPEIGPPELLHPRPGPLVASVPRAPGPRMRLRGHPGWRGSLVTCLLLLDQWDDGLAV